MSDKLSVCRLIRTEKPSRVSRSRQNVSSRRCDKLKFVGHAKELINFPLRTPQRTIPKFVGEVSLRL